MPEEIMVIVLVSIVAGVGTLLTVFFTIMRFLERKHKLPQSDGGVRTSELQTLIEQAVESATEPLRAEVRALREDLAPPKALPPAQPGQDEAFDPIEREDPEPVPSRRHRTH